jgi:hypothetical protein
MRSIEPRTAVLPERWLLLLHQLPTTPAYDTRDDDNRLARGFAIFDDLYAVFRRKRGGVRADRR